MLTVTTGEVDCQMTVMDKADWFAEDGSSSVGSTDTILTRATNTDMHNTHAHTQVYLFLSLFLFLYVLV